MRTPLDPTPAPPDGVAAALREEPGPHHAVKSPERKAWHHRTSVRVRILGFVLGAFVLVLGVTTTVAVHGAQRDQERTEAERLGIEFGVLRQLITEQVRTSQALAGSFADRADLRTHTIERSSQAIELAVAPVFDRLHQELEITRLSITDASGMPLLALSAGGRITEPPGPHAALLESHRTLQPASGVERSSDGLVIRGVAPLRVGELAVGYVELTRDFNQAFLDAAHARTGYEYALLSVEPNAKDSKGHRTLAATSRLVCRFSQDELLTAHQGHPSAVKLTQADGRDYAVLLAPVRDSHQQTLGLLVIASSRTEALAALGSRQVHTLFAALLAALVGLSALGVLLRSIVLRPLERLSKQARDANPAGRALDPAQRSGDEFERLGATLALLSTNLHHALSEQRATILDLQSVQGLLREQEANLRITLDSIADAVFVLSADGTVTNLNPGACQLLGLEPSQVLGSPLGNHCKLLFEGRESLDELLKVTLAKRERHAAGGPYAFEPQGARARTVTARATRLSLEQDETRGLAEGVVLVLRDVTEEQDLQARLRQAQKMEAVGQLAGGIAHDFNNVLASILGIAELLSLRHRNQPEIVESTSIIVDAASRAAGLVRQLLTFSRKNPPQVIPLSIHETVMSTVQLLRRSLDPRILVETQLASRLTAVRGDPSQLQSALLNLAVNARDAMPQGGTLRFLTREVLLDEFEHRRYPECSGPGAYIEVVVEDTGEGIAPETLTRVFEPFFTTKEPGKGTGLGLASVYGTARTHGGFVTADSALGEGSRFSIYLPALDAPSVAPSAARAIKLVEPRERSASVDPQLVLIVDDDPLVLRLVEESMRHLGYPTLAFSDGNLAITACREGADRFSLVILDMVMPAPGGDEVFRAIHRLAPDLPVVLLSGYARSELVSDLLREGARGYLAKPFHVSELAELVHEHARGPSGSLASPSTRLAPELAPTNSKTR